jgi:D-alanyl-D-alanine dipeptidase
MKTSLFITSLISLTFNLADAKLGEKVSPQNWEGSTVQITKEARDKILFLSANDPIVTILPIIDNGDSLVDLLKVKNPRIKIITDIPGHEKVLKTILPSDLQDIKAGHFSQVRKGLYDKLIKMLEYLPPNLGIAYVFGYQKLSFMKEIFDKSFHQYLKAGFDREEAYNKTANFIQPFVKGSTNSYSSGAAIAMTLFRTDNPEALLDLGYIGADIDNVTKPLFASTITDIQKQNRKLLVETATKAGMASYGEIWYLYTYGDQIWALLNKNPYSIYGLVTEEDKKLNHTTKDEYLRSFDAKG